MVSPYWSFALASVGVFGLYIAGRKDRRGWLVGIAAQGLWAWYAISTRQWGFLMSCLAYGSVYARNWWSWRQSEPTSSTEKSDTTRRRLRRRPAPSARSLLATTARLRGSWQRSR